MTYTYLYNFFILLIHILLIYTNIFISKTKKLKKNSPQENSSHSWLVKYTFSRYIVKNGSLFLLSAILYGPSLSFLLIKLVHLWLCHLWMCTYYRSWEVQVCKGHNIWKKALELLEPVNNFVIHSKDTFIRLTNEIC